MFVENSCVVPVSNAEETLACLQEGFKSRKVASTKMNAESSRSHLVFSVVVESVDKETGKIVTGKLTLVDLAGSERVGKTGASGDTLKEAQAINQSLSALGNVISKLSSGAKVIPYRNNPLTMLMSDSLGGNAKTLMFVNVSPVDYNTEETTNSLGYASRVKMIKNTGGKSVETSESNEIKTLIGELKGRLANAGITPAAEADSG